MRLGKINPILAECIYIYCVSVLSECLTHVTKKLYAILTGSVIIFNYHLREKIEIV